jgi:cyclase
MITKRIIPCLDIDQGRVVKGTHFLNIKDAGDPLELAKKYAESGADELVFLDITASSDKRIILKDLVSRVAKEIYIPFTVGGGLNSIEMIQEMLDLGADKVSLNTALFRHPSLIENAAQHFGSQCIVVAVDVKRITNGLSSLCTLPHLKSLESDNASIAEVYSHGGRQNLGIDAIKWIKYCESLGAGEILLTSMDTDGTASGYDTSLLNEAKKNISIPVIASGGAGTVRHIYNALQVADAALLASILHYNTFTIANIKSELKIKYGVSIRIPGESQHS